MYRAQYALSKAFDAKVAQVLIQPAADSAAAVGFRRWFCPNSIEEADVPQESFEIGLFWFDQRLLDRCGACIRRVGDLHSSGQVPWIGTADPPGTEKQRKPVALYGPKRF